MSAGTPRFRLSRLQRRLVLLFYPPILLVVLGPALISGHAADGAAVITVVELGIFALLYRVSRGFGIELQEHCALLVGLRHQLLPWDDVQAVEVDSMLGTRSVVLVGVNHRYRLRAPVTGPLQKDEDFDEKAESIRWWWVTHREPSSLPVAELLTGVRPVRTPGHLLQLVATTVLAGYAVLWFVFAVFIAPQIAGRLLGVDAVALVLICTLRPARPMVIGRWRALRTHRAGRL